MKIVSLLTLVAAVTAQQTRYDGYQVFEVLAKEQHQFQVMAELFQESDAFDFWKEPRSPDQPMDVMVPPGHGEFFTQLLRDYGIQQRIKIADVQTLIERTRTAPKVLQAPRSSARYEHNWTSYSRLSVIHDFMREMATSFPELATLTNQGQSHEGRDMLMLKISSGTAAKNAIFVDGGIHAREWISPAFVTWLISELVENYAEHPHYVDNLDWYFMPVVNPDGYEFTHTNTRLWRKNRRPNGSCIGTDLNRNFGFHWNEGGSSNSGCLETYHGGEAYSEAESRVFRDTVLSLGSQVKAYIAVHSYGQYLLTPWGYTSALPDDYDDLYALGLNATGALTAVYGTRYTVGTSTNLLGLASGCSDDWAKGAVAEGGAGIKYSYTFEMRDQGLYGFQLPPSQIIPTALETWEAVKVIAEAMMKL